ncbi:ABC transporter ATP-binding protein [Mariniplasma anaerobium]|uniref:ABC transporter ATP-binding protein n=1 Tax=Mariniplasma anaerobium TaxID=2735436 RepID=A0A7U9THA4_9MOLU|nr:ABC transporter ATP-binding protein [Mariniplasma anaerobium]BCR35212.1 ABC transporter ATP-binding protein [Mariniplasma anaerobium]
MIEVKNLYKSFNDHPVLKDINLKLEKGTIFGLIGINGAGKSTFLRLIMGILKPDYGEIKIDKYSILEDNDLKKSIFYLSDQPPFSNQMTFRNLADLYKVFYPFEEDIYKSILNIFSLNENINLSQISKGMKRQGYIALAFASGAKYLLLDEVFDGLDPSARLKFKKLMISSEHQDKIIIVTSHSLRELEDICDSFGMIDEGYFKRYGNLDFELNKLVKYQIILKDTLPIEIVDQNNEPIYINQDGRILTIVIDVNHQLDQYINKEVYHVADELPISFEEYFMINQKGANS